MTELRQDVYTMPSSPLGSANPLPDLTHLSDAHAHIEIDHDTVSEEEARYMGWGRIRSILPYTLQDGYGREREESRRPSLVLENSRLRATFLPSLGGRLWSLFDKVRGCELLHVNPVLQYANLALRNAWFSGGIEWNCGIIGHSPFTCSGMVAQEDALPDGTPLLRMFQYERVRGLIYKLEAFLPEDSDRLYVRVFIHNALPEPTAVYWWSNMAVNEKPDVRVMVPADRAFRYGYGGKLSKVPVPYMTAEADKLKGSAARLAREHGGTLDWDVSRSVCLPQSMDFFFDVPAGARPFIAALDVDGYGICQTSTPELRGRKLFVWGQGPGGKHWQTFLSKPGSAYIELQSGLARTQLEHLPLEAYGTRSWVEAYGPLQADGETVQGKDYGKACSHVLDLLNAACPEDRLEALHAVLREKDASPKCLRVLHSAETFLPAERLARPGVFSAPGLPEGLEGCLEGSETLPWLSLLRRGTLPCPPPLDPPSGYQTGEVWEELLSGSVRAGASDHWYGHYQLAVMAHARGETEKAEKAYLLSLNRAENPWALRGLALIARLRAETEKAVDLYARAAHLKPIRPLVLEAMETLLEAGAFRGMLALFDDLSPELRRDGRLQVLRACALLRSGAPDEAEAVLRSGLVFTDIREGDTLLTDLWFELACLREKGAVTEEGLAWAREHVTPPAELDFRML